MAASYLSVKGKVESLLIDGLGTFLADSTHGEGTHASSALLGQGLTKAFGSYYRLKKNLEDETIDCALMALTKSGQSPAHSKVSAKEIAPETSWTKTLRSLLLSC